MKNLIERDTVRIKLMKGNERTNTRVCMLVADVFVPNPDDFKFIKFKDGNSINVNSDNLYWANNTSKKEDDPDEIWESVLGFPQI